MLYRSVLPHVLPWGDPPAFGVAVVVVASQRWLSPAGPVCSTSGATGHVHLKPHDLRLELSDSIQPSMAVRAPLWLSRLSGRPFVLAAEALAREGFLIAEIAIVVRELHLVWRTPHPTLLAQFHGSHNHRHAFLVWPWWNPPLRRAARGIPALLRCVVTHLLPVVSAPDAVADEDLSRIPRGVYGFGSGQSTPTLGTLSRLGIEPSLPGVQASGTLHSETRLIPQSAKWTRQGDSHSISIDDWTHVNQAKPGRKNYPSYPWKTDLAKSIESNARPKNVVKLVIVPRNTGPRRQNSSAVNLFCPDMRGLSQNEISASRARCYVCNNPLYICFALSNRGANHRVSTAITKCMYVREGCGESRAALHGTLQGVPRGTYALPKGARAL
jgi:hypothetical protein